MATPVKVRRLSDEEGRQLQRIVRRGGGKTDKSIVKWRRALVVLASAGGNDVAAIARLVQTSPDRVREMIHSFNEKGMPALDPQWAGGRPRRITTEQRSLIITTATQRPTSLGMPFSKWSIRKLAQYLATTKGGRIAVSRERLRQILAEEDITFQRPRPGRSRRSSPRGEARPHRVAPRARAGEDLRLRRVRTTRRQARRWVVLGREVQATAAAGELSQAPRDEAAVRLVLDRCRSPLWPHRTEEGCGPDTPSAQGHPGPGPDGGPIHVILDNLNHHKGKALRQWCDDNAVELAFTPTYGSWANPIEAHFGPLRQFTIANSDYQDHTELATAIRNYIRWRNANTRDPEVLALERKHRAISEARPAVAGANPGPERHSSRLNDLAAAAGGTVMP